MQNDKSFSELIYSSEHIIFVIVEAKIQFDNI